MEYFIKASAILTLFFLFYKLLLQKETFFQLNRIFLLCGLISSVLLPLIVIPIYIETPVVHLTNVPILQETNSAVPATSIDWLQIIAILYIAGTLWFLTKFLISFISLLKLTFKNSGVRNIKGIKYIELESTSSPFSIFNTIVYNPKMFTELELEQIIAHEKVHVKQKHSIDVLLTEILAITFWFNPFIWLYKKEIHQNLEYIADSNSTEEQKNSTNYQHLLLKTCFPNYKLSLTNNFYNSLIKKRITMLQSKKSKKINQWKTTLIIPIMVGFIVAFNTEVIAQTSIKANKVVEGVKLDATISKDKKTYVRQGISSQEYIISGKINNEKGNPLPQVLVTINGNKHGILSNKFGGFAINVQKGNVLTFSQLGKISQKITIFNGEPLSITLEKDPNFVDEIIEEPVQKEEIIEVPVQTEEIIEIPISQTKQPLIIIDGKISFLSLENLDKNQLYSLSILKGEQAKEKYGEKGANGVIEITTKKNESITIVGYKNKNDSTIKIRSTKGNDPLIVIDGKISSKNASELEPDKIESMSVLKGQTAIDKHGDKGKDGVVEITTKKN